MILKNNQYQRNAADVYMIIFLCDSNFDFDELYVLEKFRICWVFFNSK